MPYIKPEVRKHFDKHIVLLLGEMQKVGAIPSRLEDILLALCRGWIWFERVGEWHTFGGNIGALIRAQRGPVDQFPGDLNYIISTICKGYLMIQGVRYAHMNAIVGALAFVQVELQATLDGASSSIENAMFGVLECVKLEFYRRLATPYEDVKCDENGDVPDLTQGD